MNKGNTLSKIRQLAAFQNLTPATDLEFILNNLEKELVQYNELEYRSDEKGIDLITRSINNNSTSVFLEILKKREITESRLSLLKVFSRFGIGKTFGMKLPIAGPTDCGELYIGGALPLAEVNQFLKRHSVEKGAIECVNKVAWIFGKSYSHIFGTDVSVDYRFTIYFTAYLRVNDEQNDSKLLHKALKVIGIERRTIDEFFALHGLLGANRPMTLFFSCYIANGKFVHYAKIDYEDIRLGVVSEVVDAVDKTDQADILIQWGNQLGMYKANYAGILLGPEGFKRICAYFSKCLTPISENRIGYSK